MWLVASYRSQTGTASSDRAKIHPEDHLVLGCEVVGVDDVLHWVERRDPVDDHAAVSILDAGQREQLLQVAVLFGQTGAVGVSGNGEDWNLPIAFRL